MKRDRKKKLGFCPNQPFAISTFWGWGEVPTYSEDPVWWLPLYHEQIGIPDKLFFIRPRSDHSLRMSVTHSLTDSLHYRLSNEN